MNGRDAIKTSIESSSFVYLMYLDDLTDQEMMQRPCDGCNHINWQVGHLIVSENHLINQALPGAMPPLPTDFASKYTNDTAGSDDAKKFASKVELMRCHTDQRAATLHALSKQSESDLEKPTGIHYAPTVAALFLLQGSHWLMHSGQWVVVRRQLGRKPLF